MTLQAIEQKKKKYLKINKMDLYGVIWIVALIIGYLIGTIDDYF